MSNPIKIFREFTQENIPQEKCITELFVIPKSCNNPNIHWEENDYIEMKPNNSIPFRTENKWTITT